MTYTIYGKLRGNGDWQWLSMGIQSYDEVIDLLRGFKEENDEKRYWTEFKIVIDEEE